MEFTTENIWNYLIEKGIADQLELVTAINGYTIETLNSVIYARTGFKDVEQLKEEINENMERV